MKRKTIFYIILICGLSNSIQIYSQNETTVDSKELYKRWTEYPDKTDKYNINQDSIKFQDTIEYIPYNSKLTDDLEPFWKYQGPEFGESGSFTQHIWNKCGTGNPPNFYLGSWKIKIDKNKTILIIVGGQDQMAREYYLHFLNAEKLVLVNKK